METTWKNLLLASTVAVPHLIHGVDIVVQVQDEFYHASFIKWSVFSATFRVSLFRYDSRNVYGHILKECFEHCGHGEGFLELDLPATALVRMITREDEVHLDTS